MQFRVAVIATRCGNKSCESVALCCSSGTAPGTALVHEREGRREGREGGREGRGGRGEGEDSGGGCASIEMAIPDRVSVAGRLGALCRGRDRQQRRRWWRRR